MPHSALLGLLAGALVLATAPAPATTLAATPKYQPVPIKALSRTPAIQSVSMSPDGKHIVALIPQPDKPSQAAIAIWDVDNLPAAPKYITPSGRHMKFIAAEALKAGKVIAVARQQWEGQLHGCGEGNATGSTKTFITKVYLTGDKLEKFHEAFKDDHHSAHVNKALQRCLELGSSARVVDALPLDPDHVIIERMSLLSLMTNYYLYNLKTGKADLLFRGGGRITPSLFDRHTGQVLVKSAVEPVGNDYEKLTYIRDPKTGQFVVQKPLTNLLSDRHEVSVVGIDDATGKYYVLTDQFSDQVQARLYDARAQKYDPQPLVAVKDFSIGGLIFSHRKSNFNQVIGFVVDGPASRQVFVDPAMKGLQASLQKAFPGLTITILDYNNDLSRVLFSTENNDHPTDWYVLADHKKVINIGSERPWINPKDIGTEKWVTYTARDGLAIPAILSLPPGWQKGDKPLPAVIIPHGGPWSRGYMGWPGIPWVTMLTSRGYAVLRPQFRGTEGLGRKLWLAGDKQWGLKMSDDNDDGAAWLVKQGIAAKDRIAIYGYSYGGFAAVAADVRSPSPYQCAIAGAPVANLGRLGTSWSSNRLQRILQGRTVKGMDPMRNTAKAHLPILLFGGDRDVRVPSYHPRDYYKAVKDIVPAKYVIIPDMPHSLPWYPRQKKQVLNLIINYLQKDCGPGGL
ncbi:MAG TPA: prolyl oligopeptidase family serine peptidase [Rhodanobacteraceae bacterium]